MEDKSLIDNALVSNGMEERLLGLTGERGKGYMRTDVNIVKEESRRKRSE